MSDSINRFAMMREYRTYFIYHINKGLRVILKEAADRVTLILAREERLDQGGEFMRSERTPD
jgi:hypothetical protein